VIAIRRGDGGRRDPIQKMRRVALVGSLLRRVHIAARRYRVEITPVQDFVHVLSG